MKESPHHNVLGSNPARDLCCMSYQFLSFILFHVSLSAHNCPIKAKKPKNEIESHTEGRVMVWFSPQVRNKWRKMSAMASKSKTLLGFCRTLR